ncbi:MAG TPA: c-type cytochrome [Candidatus Obscuribacterales bacterium]
MTGKLQMNAGSQSQVSMCGGLRKMWMVACAASLFALLTYLPSNAAEPVIVPNDAGQEVLSAPPGDAEQASPLAQSQPADPAGKAQAGDAAAATFTQKCAGCHTVGRGNMVGPDLVEVVEWKTDALTANVKRMEKFTGALPDQVVKSLVDFLKDPKAAARIKAEEQRSVAAQLTSEPSSAEMGKKLFLGSERFKAGGMACIACHQVEGHGGTMGADLTDAHARLGEAALISACEEPSYPVMKAIYKDHKITKQEAMHVTKFLASIKDSKARQPDPPVAPLGAIGAAVFLGGLMLFYRNRNTGVRSRLHRR